MSGTRDVEEGADTSRVMADSRLVFKIADRPEEFEAIHRLNYRTFVEEIPQHAANPARRLVDRFHPQNTYIVCIDGQELAGMLALRTERPFSLDLKLPNIDELLPPGRRIGEVRLLAVDPSHRHTAILPGLFRLLEREALGRGLTMLIVSATTRQRRLYDRLGFIAFGPAVGSVQARFQPMCLTLERFREVESTYAWRHERPGHRIEAAQGEERKR